MENNNIKQFIIIYFYILITFVSAFVTNLSAQQNQNNALPEQSFHKFGDEQNLNSDDAENYLFRQPHLRQPRFRPTAAGDSLNVRLVGSFDTEGLAYGVAVSGRYAYIADYGGLRVINVLIRRRPQQIDFLDTGGAMDVVCNGPLVFVAGGAYGLRVIDASNPGSLTELGSLDTGGSAWAVAVNGSYAYVADKSGGLRVIDISTTSSPQEVSSFDTGGMALDVVYADGFVFVADGNAGLRVINVSSPENPQEAGFFYTGSPAVGIAHKENYAYVTYGNDGMRVIDVSSPSNPQEMAFFSTGGYAYAITVNDNLAYIADGSAGLRVIEISNPNSPQEVGYFDTDKNARDVTVSENYIYVADNDDGLYILEYLGAPPESTIANQPANDSFTKDNTPSLSWFIPMDADNDLLHFKVEIAADSSFVNQVIGSPFESCNNLNGFSPTPPLQPGSGTCSFTSTGNLSEGTYYWRVSGYDGQHYGDTSELRKFTIDNTSPYTANHNPAKNDTNVSINTNIIVHLNDDLSGVKQSAIVMKVNDESVEAVISGSALDYTLTYNPENDFDRDATVSISIDAEDLAGNQMNTDNYHFNTVALDQTAPMISESQTYSPNSGQSQDISVTITDNVSIQEAKLYYRMGGAVIYQSSDMTNTSGDMYQGTIPSSFITSRGVEYYISAKDTSDNTTYYPAVSNPMENPQIVRVRSANLARSDSTVEMVYRMISVPNDLNNPSPHAVLEDDWGSYDDSLWRLLRYVNGNYREYTVHSSFDEFKPGYGFWLITRDAKILSVGAGYGVTTAKNYAIELQPGWNQIGNPYAFAVNWSDVIRNEDVENVLVGYYGLQNEYEGYDTTPTQLEPWQGYFINNRGTSTTTIEIPPVAASGSLAKKAAGILAPKDFQDTEWGLQITAVCKLYIDKDNYLGCLTDASNKCDRHDFSEPPFFIEYISLYFPHEDWDEYPGLYTADFRPVRDEGQYWDFHVKTNITNSEVCLTLSDIQNLPADWDIQLIDQASNISINFRDKTQYAFYSGKKETAREFRIIVGQENFIEENDMDILAAPQEFELSQNYPNPFNPETRISYTLPSASCVKIAIYNVKGQLIQILTDERQSAGRYSVAWNGVNDNSEKVVSGVYFARMVAGGFVAVRKMVLTR